LELIVVQLFYICFVRVYLFNAKKKSINQSINQPQI
jgi:hypothetical protein